MVRAESSRGKLWMLPQQLKVLFLSGEVRVGCLIVTLFGGSFPFNVVSSHHLAIFLCKDTLDGTEAENQFEIGITTRHVLLKPS